jgi:hypothetical protein
MTRARKSPLEFSALIFVLLSCALNAVVFFLPSGGQSIRSFMMEGLESGEIASVTFFILALLFTSGALLLSLLSALGLGNRLLLHMTPFLLIASLLFAHHLFYWKAPVLFVFTPAVRPLLSALSASLALLAFFCLRVQWKQEFNEFPGILQGSEQK